MSRPLFLTGMMGSGKSTVGRLLAGRCGAYFVDLDLRIERLFGCGIAELFARGEAEFRRLERRALESLVAEPGWGGRAVVVATGGGVVVAAANRTLMRDVGAVVYLHAGLDVLARRLSRDERVHPGARPVLAEGSEGMRARVGALLRERAAAYAQCDLVVDAQGAPVGVAARIEAALYGDLGWVAGAARSVPEPGVAPGLDPIRVEVE